MSDENLSAAQPKKGGSTVLVVVIILIALCGALWALNVGGLRFHIPAIASAAGHGDQAKVLELLQQGANPNEPDGDGAMPLEYALLNGHIDVADTLCVAGAEVNVKDKKGQTMLQRLEKALQGKSGEQQKKVQASVDWLKKQIEMRAQPRGRPSVG